MAPVYWRQVLELSHITMIYLDLQTNSCIMVVSIRWWFQIFTWKMVVNHHFHPLKQMVLEGHQVRYLIIGNSEKLHETIPCSPDIPEFLGSNSPPFGSENTSTPFSLYIVTPPRSLTAKAAEFFGGWKSIRLPIGLEGYFSEAFAVKLREGIDHTISMSLWQRNSSPDCTWGSFLNH